MAIQDLQTNIPIAMKLKYVDYAPPKDDHPDWPARLKLKGDVDGIETLVYVPLPCGGDLTSHGFMTKTGGVDRYGHPAFKVQGRPDIVILRTEEGTKKNTTITPPGAVGAKPAKAGPTPAPAAAAPGRPTYASIEAQYAWALAAARRLWGEETTDVTLHATAATLFIEANQQGVAPPAPPMKTVVPGSDPDGFDQVPAALRGEEEDDSLPFD